mmetsp:Transcript_19262/g.44625  ORF Transcript_19262/g.44625 Transcript_19262/m.44625 type:complete len:86 (-) Transcript_19262:112-369(-)
MELPDRVCNGINCDEIAENHRDTVRIESNRNRENMEDVIKKSSFVTDMSTHTHTRIILRHATIKRFYELCRRSSRNETKRHTSNK